MESFKSIERLKTLDFLDTGDILLFHGTYFFSHVVEWFTKSKFSHVAMVLRDPTYLDPSLKGLYMIESGAETFPNAVSHRIVEGVQIVDLHKVVSQYQGQIYYRKMISNNHNKRISTQLPQIWQKIQNCKYDSNIIHLLAAAYDIPYRDDCRTKTYFCSALITFLFERFGFFFKPMAWDLMTPEDFNDDGKIDRDLKPLLTKKTRIK